MKEDRRTIADPRPYAALLAKGEDRRQRILAVAQRLLRRQGWRSTTLGQIAREAGISTAGVLHHFESKEQLLHAILDARDADDESHSDYMSGDLVEELGKLAERFRRSPDLVGLFAILRVENIDPEAPLHQRFRSRHRVALETVSAFIRDGQRSGKYRVEPDPAVLAAEIVAFLNGIETTWLLDPSFPLSEVFREYVASLDRRLAPPSDAS
ncbi:TetR family transcriptional regulator [Actinocorallia herbida]|uniref:TetR family transcriptional regulator n=1 Tax=Actinocorallia herbida TaxID=58109 RepID=A0A3N1CUJ5_9ACTN|nr:TetR/AcrR family transcriptional regulator [Actinocorallia herbida]ROO84905.1 TetR family transcriptional regulator [Actinocorallia herbida]